jgi:hypothetical protein
MMAMMFDRAGLKGTAAVAMRQEAAEMPPPVSASAADK